MRNTEKFNPSALQENTIPRDIIMVRDGKVWERQRLFIHHFTE